MTTSQPQYTPSSSATIDPATQVGVVALTVADLDRSLTFYTQGMGFEQLTREGPTAILGVAGAPRLVLREEPGAKRVPARATGLYHFAILVPSRVGLGRWLRHWLELGLPLPGQGDHLVSEALYLSDPDGHGIEIYRDRPRAEWTWEDGHVQMAAEPVDIRGLLEEASREPQPWSGLEAGTRIGHVHLKVGDIAQAKAFYHDILGFDIVAEMQGALFVSAGGYHHHLGLNTWQSRGAGPAPAGTAGLWFFSLGLSSAEALGAVASRLRAAVVAFTEADGALVTRDPWSNVIVLHLGADPETSAVAAFARSVPTAAEAAR